MYRIIIVFILAFVTPSFAFAAVPTSKMKPQVNKRDQVLRARRLIVIDPGHGGLDQGAEASEFDEKTIALKTAVLAKKYLIERGYRVVLTRSRDVFVPLKVRSSIANKTKSKLFLSFHFNAAKQTEVSGIEIFYYEGGEKWRSLSSKKLARCVLNKLIVATGSRSRGIKKGNFHVIRETNMPAILIEGGFMTHQQENAKLGTPQYLEKIAKAVADGVDRYFQV